VARWDRHRDDTKGGAPVADDDTETQPGTEPKRRRGATAAAKAKAGADLVRLRLAQLVWIVCVLAALVLAVGALLIALGDSIDQKNDLVKFVLDLADNLDFGVLGRTDGVFDFDGKNADVKNALANWGVAAIVWLIGGRIIDRIVRP
jgi:hypothetical protein